MASTANRARKMMMVVVVAVISSILLATVFPVGIDAIAGDETTTLQHGANDSAVQLSGNLDANVTSISASDATVELTYNGQATSQTIADGTSEDLAINGVQVNTTVDSIASDQSSATVSYQYPTGAGWPGPVRLIFESLVYFLILLPLGALAAMVADMFE